jgi:HD-GYP domain-containing protein (c-di-GMP phosphodiesterase class II)
MARKTGLLSLWHHHPLRMHIATMFTALVFAACGTIMWNNHVQGRSLVLASTDQLVQEIGAEASTELRVLFAPVETLVMGLSSGTVAGADSFAAHETSLPSLAEMLNRLRQVDAIYAGYDNGEFFLVRALRDDAQRQRLGAPANAAFMVRSIDRPKGELRSRVAFLDESLNRISETQQSDVDFDPRQRSWYASAMSSGDLRLTGPYVFFTTGEPGLTVSRRSDRGRAVIGADVTLSRISQKLRQVRPTPSSQLAIIDPKTGRVLAASEPLRIAKPASGKEVELPRVADFSPALSAVAADAGRFIESSRLDVANREWFAKASTAVLGGDRVVSFAIAAPLDELMQKADAALRRTALLALAVIFVCVPVTWWIAQRIAGNLRDLTDQAAAIRRFDFSDQSLPRTRINEIFGLGRAMGDMRRTIHRFLDITTALAAERNFDRLLQRVLNEAHESAGGDGGAIYLLDDDGRFLKPAAQAWNDGGHASPVDLSMSDRSNPIVQSVMRHETAAGTHVIAPARPAGLEYIDRAFGPSPVTLVTVPLLNRAGEAVGVLCSFFGTKTEIPSTERLALVQAFAGAGAAAIDNQRLLIAQKALLESFIGLIASAIDAKSPYTGGHCQRVPELTKMLARAACDTKTGPLAKFDMDDDHWEALHIAGWLHDCGKVTTPEFVVDKATKLETIYDRIHEVRMRFEVLKRDAEIACLKAVAAGGDEARLRAELAQQLSTLDQEFAFVATCNEGGEFMAPDKIARLKAIAARSWQRTLDNRLGVSYEEAKRFARTPPSPLPVTETVLADRPEHIIERGPLDQMPPDNPWGFRLQVPEHLYNRGEVYNLSVARGTLSEEERYKINDHIAQTIIMLTKLPFPKHLRSIPELAGGHHEKMDGTGYPKRLSRGDMSVQARIMAIADIFEALTATDRPYKKGKKLSEAIAIMGRMKKDQHIDPDLFDLFLESGVYRTYAQRYMAPEYVDEVNVRSYVPSAL